jgi:hypothetical protein
MVTKINIVAYTFLFNILTIIIFSWIYSSIPAKNFKPLNHNDELTYIDYLFYAVTIQSGVGLPDVTALSNLSKILVIIQQLILLGSGFILISLFVRN